MTPDRSRRPRWIKPGLALAAVLAACSSSAPSIEVFAHGEPALASVQAGSSTTVTVEFRVRASVEGDEQLALSAWLHLACEVQVPPTSGLTVTAAGACDTSLFGATMDTVVKVELTVSAGALAPAGAVDLPVMLKACAPRKVDSPLGVLLLKGEGACDQLSRTQRLQVTPAPASPPIPPPASPQLTGELLANAGFEQPPQLGTLPGEPGFWRGDLSTQTAAVGSIAPRQGSFMLQFLATGPTPSAQLLTSQQWQLVDLRPWAAAIDAGGVKALGSAWFHRVTGSALTDRRFDLRLLAFGGDAAGVPAGYAGQQQLAVAATQIDTDGSAWRQAQATLAVPAGTRWLLVEIYAYEDVFNDAAAPEFDGHFADDLSLRLQLP